MEIIDTHTHLYLDQFDNDFDEMIQRSFDCGVKKFVFPSISSKYNEKMLGRLKKYPDNIVYNEESGEFDANLKSYPTTVGSQKFEPINVDKSDSIKADKYFKSRLDELRDEYKKLVEEMSKLNGKLDPKFNRVELD